LLEQPRGSLRAVCGRYSLSTPIADLAEQFRADETLIEGFEASWNVAPTHRVPVVASSKDGAIRKLGQMRWGLIPSWAKDAKVGFKLINARAETVATSASYRRAFATRRCLLPADGYYEWQARPAIDGATTAKQPYWIYPVDGQPLALGGVWEVWYDTEGQRLTTFSIVTTAANGITRRVHNRMPLIVPASRWDRWLAPEPLDPVDAAQLLVPAATGLLALRPVSTAVNNFRNDTPELIDAAGEHAREQPGSSRQGGRANPGLR
jgi:putative SOS response-associated peptidase YedK